MEPDPTRKKRSKKIHQTQLFRNLLSHDQVNDIKENDLVDLSRKAKVDDLYVDPSKEEDYIPFEYIPILERQKTLNFIETDIVDIMKKRTEFESTFDKIPKIDISHFHYDMMCPYQSFFSCPFRDGLKDVETCSKSPTDMLNKKQKKYLEDLGNYKSFQKVIMPKMRKTNQDQFFQFGTFADELNKKCGKITFMNLTADNGYLVGCARMDRNLDLIFLCIVFKHDRPLDPKFFGEDKKNRLVLDDDDDEEEKTKEMKRLHVKFCKYFYFSCGCDSETTRKEFSSSSLLNDLDLDLDL